MIKNMMIKQKFFALLAALLCLSAFAAKPSEPSATRLFDALDFPQIVGMGLEKSLSEHFGQVLAAYSEAKRAAAEQALERFRQKVIADIKKPENTAAIRKEFVREIRRSASQEDVDGMIALFESEEGRDTLKHMPNVARATAEEILDSVPSVWQAVQAKYLPELEQELDGILL